MEHKNNYLLHIGLFFATFLSTTLAGILWTSGADTDLNTVSFSQGLPYSLSLLFVLSVHEFGHYFAARFHKINTSLPYYIPIPPFPGFIHFGTMGAVIRTREKINSNKVMFDIGVWGPLAGFVACIIVLVYGFINLPGQEYILSIHPDFFSPEYGKDTLTLEFGNSILFSALQSLFTSPDQFVPPMSEIYHYPYLTVGWFGLFVTALNLIPVGQLDGGHIVYSMFGTKKHNHIAGFSMLVILVLGFIDVFSSLLNLGITIGWTGWLFWAAILYFLIKIQHPPVEEFEELDSGRMILGYIAIAILILSFTPNPFVIY